MEETLLDIARALESCEILDDRALTKIINRHNKRLVEEAKRNGSRRAPTYAGHGLPGQSHNDEPPASDAPRPTDTRPLSKKRLMRFYLDTKKHDPARWARWNLAPEAQQRIEATLRMKPRRTASGVATVTVLTKPWKCSSDCLYCPNDIRMPKSYLANEPACQRAERVCFDPYAQAALRLRALEEMGHVTDKVELIVLGGTWSDYPLGYQIWFMRELFRALNDGDAAPARAFERLKRYEQAGIPCDPDEIARQTAAVQARIDAGEETYNRAFDAHYAASPAWQQIGAWQHATWEELEVEHAKNEHAARRVVGLVVETRPELCRPRALTALRRLGCTKVQMGIQSLDACVLAANDRRTTPADIARAFEALRLFGFKTHVHAMVNLYGSTPEADKRDYRRLMSETPYQPDEVKLYPCVLMPGTGLRAHHRDGSWQPYREDQLVDVLVSDVLATPAFCRISRMIRDFSAPDIAAGNKKVNLRQEVERRIDEGGMDAREIRHREVSLAGIRADELSLEEIAYETTATDERFLQWTTPEGKIAGFCRLSLPKPEAIRAYGDALPVSTGEAMIREVHVYGRVAGIAQHGDSAEAPNGQHNQKAMGQSDAAATAPTPAMDAAAAANSAPAVTGGAQHRGLGTQLVERACELARQAGYKKINVISAVGTRGYYRKLGFTDNGLYQQRAL